MLKGQSGGPNYVFLAALVAAGIGLVVRIFFPWEAIPFRFGQFLRFDGRWWEPFLFASPLFVIGFLLNISKMATSINPPEVHENAPMIPINGVMVSIFAGVMEEICFRWVFFYGAMSFYWIVGLGLSTLLTADVSAWFTHDPLRLFNLFLAGFKPELVSLPGGWTLGLAVLASNWKFQQGHLYQGKVGATFAFAGGFLFFWITFRYGLLASMLVHFVFDLSVFAMLFVDVLIEQAMGYYKPKRKLYQAYSGRTQ